MNGAPKYRQIADMYRDQILAGTLKEGERLPPRRRMTEKHKVSRTTIDRAMDLLLMEGIVQSAGRSRAMVTSAPRATGLEDRLSSLRATGKALAENETSIITRVEMMACPPEIARYLGVTEGADVLIRERVTRKNGRPVATSRSYYGQETVRLTPELRRPVSIPSGSRELAAERLGSRVVLASQEFTSRMSTQEEMELLDIGRRMKTPAGEVRFPVPVSQVMRVAFLEDGRIAEAAVKVTEGSLPVIVYMDMNRRLRNLK